DPWPTEGVPAPPPGTNTFHLYGRVRGRWPASGVLVPHRVPVDTTGPTCERQIGDACHGAGDHVRGPLPCDGNRVVEIAWRRCSALSIPGSASHARRGRRLGSVACVRRDLSFRRTLSVCPPSMNEPARGATCQTLCGV